MFLKLLVYALIFGIAGRLAYLIVKRLTPVVMKGGRPVKEISVMTWTILMTVIASLIGTILIYAGIDI